MWVVAGICIAVMVVAMLGCGGTERAPLRPVDVDSEAPVLLDDGIPGYSEEERAEAASFMAGVEPTFNELRFDDIEDAFPKAQNKAVGYTALTGWSIEGELRFQQQGARTPGIPHCELFGLDCDDEWHAQATSLNWGFVIGRGFGDVARNGCGSDTIMSDGRSNLWLPCATAYLTESDREITWFFDENTCPADAAGRRAVRDGMRGAAQFMNNYSSVAVREDTSPEFAELLLTCATHLPSDTAARWQPMGEITLRYGSLKGPMDLTVITHEQCETRGLPGQFGRNFSQGLDMMYTYDYANIMLNWTAQFEKIAECTTDPSEMARVWRNTLLHEVGHHLGFHHEGYDHDDYGIMFGGSVACDRMATFSRGFDDYHLFSILNMDVDPNGSEEFVIWDEDLSCYNPEF